MKLELTLTVIKYRKILMEVENIAVIGKWGQFVTKKIKEQKTNLLGI